MNPIEHQPLKGLLAGETLVSKVATVIDATGGIGSCIAELFAAAGAAVMLADIRHAQAAEVAPRIED